MNVTVCRLFCSRGDSMLPPLIAEAFRSFPHDIVDVCRAHTWEQLTAAPADGMRSVRDILVHLMENEFGWIRHVVRGEPRREFDPARFSSLDMILHEWLPLRMASADTVLALTVEQQRERRPLPWDVNATVSVAEVIWHVVGHDQYHRGQVFTRLALMGHRDLPDYDLIRAT